MKMKRIVYEVIITVKKTSLNDKRGLINDVQQTLCDEIEPHIVNGIKDLTIYHNLCDSRHRFNFMIAK